MQRLRRLAIPFTSVLGKRKAADISVDDLNSDAVPKRPHKKNKTSIHRYGGGQRAYISEQLKLRRLRLRHPDVPAMLSREYSQLPERLKMEYIGRGKVAKKAGAKLRRKGMTSFGVNRAVRDGAKKHASFQAATWNQMSRIS